MAYFLLSAARMPKRFASLGVGGVCALAGVYLALVTTPALALHKESPGAYRFTSGSSHYHPSTRSWENYFAFSSTEDLAGNGNSRRQIFSFNLAHFDCFNGTTLPGTPCPSPLPPFLVQLTNGAGEPDNPSIARAFDRDQNGVDDTQWVAFDALGSFNGSTGPSASHRQIFLKNLLSGEIRQVTFGTDGDSTMPSLTSLGGLVVFQSTARLTGNPTPPAISQIFVYETNSRILRQITNGAGPSTRALTNQNGNLIVFQSTADLLATLGDTGTSQVFWAEYDKNTHTAQVRQLTRGNGPSRNPFISDADGIVVFDSSATDLPGTLGGGGTNVYMTNNVGNLTQPVRIRQLTTAAGYGDCTFPVVDSGSVTQQVKFICTGDPLANLTTGNRLFAIDLQSLTLYQITGSGDIQGPIASNMGTWFLTLATTSDLSRQGACGYQLYFVDYSPDNPRTPWVAATQRGQLPPDAIAPNGSSIIGVRTFDARPGASGTGSTFSIATPAASATGNMPNGGSMRLVIGAPDEFTGRAAINVSAENTSFPPVPIAGFGTLCLGLTADGHGAVDCDGIDPGGDVAVSQDHMVDDTDPLCLAPDCREDDAACQGTLPGPHRTLCPVCVGTTPTNPNDGTCVGGQYDGQPCSTDEACQGSLACHNGTVATCNGAMVAEMVGTYTPGGMLLSLPVNVSLARDPGGDGKFCTGDDVYTAVRNVPATLRMTTGAATGTVADADGIGGGLLSATESGAAVSCARLRAGDLGGARLIGMLPFLDIPNMPALHDLLVTFRLEAAPPTGACGSTVGCSSNDDCNDGDPCNGPETCELTSGLCVPGNPFVCDDGDPCNGVETCDTVSGACIVTTPCDDGDPCNGVETCDGTGCHAGTPVACTDDLACNGAETCNSADGTCQLGTPLVCDDGNPCTADSCDDAVGCVNTPIIAGCDDGNACTTGDACTGGVCTGTPTQCADPDACNGIETCDTATGGCLPGVPPTCNDGNPCTDDSCDAAFGCLFVNNNLGCDDASVCTTGDVCLNGTCTGTAIPCGDTDVCNGSETCDPLLGCLPGTPLVCNDGNACTDDLCDQALGCLYSNNNLGCDDGSACTTGDVCALGVCAGVPVTCSDGNICNGVETCDPASGCQPGNAVSCDDGNPCTDDLCDAVFGCLYANNNILCDDGSQCTSGDICVAGVCTGVPLVCNDGNMCNGLELCNPFSGTCDIGLPLDCDDLDPCTIDACDPLTGCTHVIDPGGVGCLVGNLIFDVGGSAPAELGGTKRQRQLRVRLEAIRVRIDKAATNPRRAHKNYLRAYKSLIKFQRAIRDGVTRLNFDLEVANQLMTKSTRIMDEVKRLLNENP